MMSYKEAFIKAQEINKELEISAFTSKKKARVVSWLHGDGSRFEIVFACVKKISKDFIAIFTEHQGIFVYHIDDVDWIREHLRPKSIYVNKDIYK